MRYSELVESAPPGRYFYHVTTSNRVKSIMKHGLETGRHRRWRNAFGAMQGERGYVYLISDYTQAVRFAAKQAYDYRNSRMEPVILQLQNVPTDDLMPDDHVDSGLYYRNTWYKLRTPIPPEDIVRVIPFTPEMTKQAVQANQANQSIPEPVDEVPAEPASPRMV